MQVVNKDHIVIIVYVVDINIVQSGINHPALFAELHDGIKPQLNLLSLFKSHLCREFLHLLHHGSGQVLTASFQYLTDFGYLSVVIGS